MTSRTERKKSIQGWAVWLAVIPAAAIIIYLLLWYGPDLIARHDVGNVTGPLRVLRLQQARDAARGRLLTLGAGLFAAGALIFTAQNYRLARRTLEVTEQGQVTDRYTKAVEQLGSYNKLDVRIGGVYALERVARDSPRDHPTVIEVLAAFVREHSRERWPVSEPSDGELPERSVRPDVQAALTVIGRRDVTHDRQRIDLTNAVLPSALLFDADLVWARLVGALLKEAQLNRANLNHALLNDADLSGAHLMYAHLDAALLIRANLTGADLGHATLRDARLNDALLRGTFLTLAICPNADLTGADLTAADLTGADLTSATLGGGNLTGATLADANLTDANLADATLTDANLTHVNLAAATATDANFARANLTRANLTNATLAGAILTQTDLSYATLTAANLFGANLAEAQLTEADLADARWPPDAVVPEGWQRDADSGQLKRADTGLGEAAD